MTEQEEMLHSIAIEKAVEDLGIDRVMSIIEGICEKDLTNLGIKKDDFDEVDTTKDIREDIL